MTLNPQQIIDARKKLGIPVGGISSSSQSKKTAKQLSDEQDKEILDSKPIEKPDLGNKIASNISEHGKEAQRIIDDPTEGNFITRGIKAAGQAAEAVGSPITEGIKHIVSLLPDNFTKAPQGINPNSPMSQEYKDKQKDAPANDLQKAIFDWSQQHPDASGQLKNTLQSLSAGGEIAGTVLGAEGIPDNGITKISEIPGAISKTAGEAKQSATDLYKSITEKDPAKMEATIIEKYNKGVRPGVSGKNNATQIEGAEDKTKTAIQAIVDNKPNLQFEGGSARLPQTLKEFSQGIEQTKGEIFKKYDALQKASGEAGGKVDLNKVSTELGTIADDTVLQDVNPSVAAYAKKQAETFAKREEYTPEQAQKAIKLYNDSLDAYYKNPSYETASKASIDSLIANIMRKGLDDVIESTAGPGYQELKNQYGSLKSIEKDVAHRAIVDGRKNTKGLIDFSDIFSGSELLNGVLHMNPASLISGAAAKGMSSYIKYLNDPNVAIKKMFETAEKLGSTKEISPGSFKGATVPETVYYHGTSPENAANIEKNGFRIDKSGEINGGILGKGIYLDKTGGEGAKLYGGKILKVKVPSDIKLWKGDLKDLYIKETDYGNSSKITEYLENQGYDGIEMDNQISIFDPKKLNLK